MKFCNRIIHAVKHLEPLVRRSIRKKRIPVNLSLDIIHYIKWGPKNCFIHAKQVSFWNRHICLSKGRQDSEFPVHCMGGRQKLAGRFTSDNPGLPICRNLIGRIGLSSFELCDFSVSIEILEIFPEKSFNFVCIQLQSTAHGLGT